MGLPPLQPPVSPRCLAPGFLPRLAAFLVGLVRPPPGQSRYGLRGVCRGLICGVDCQADDGLSLGGTAWDSQCCEKGSYRNLSSSSGWRGFSRRGSAEAYQAQ
jgi:hypothetical protein